NPTSYRAPGADRSRGVSAVIIVIERAAGVGDGVETMRPGGTSDRLAPNRDSEGRRRRPDVRGQVGMVKVNARVDHADHNGIRTWRNVPGLNCADVRAGNPGLAPDYLARIVQPPHLAESSVVGSQLVTDDVIRLDVQRSRNS